MFAEAKGLRSLTNAAVLQSVIAKHVGAAKREQMAVAIRRTTIGYLPARADHIDRIRVFTSFSVLMSKPVAIEQSIVLVQSGRGITISPCIGPSLGGPNITLQETVDVWILDASALPSKPSGGLRKNCAVRTKIGIVEICGSFLNANPAPIDSAIQFIDGRANIPDHAIMRFTGCSGISDTCLLAAFCPMQGVVVVEAPYKELEVQRLCDVTTFVTILRSLRHVQELWYSGFGNPRKVSELQTAQRFRRYQRRAKVLTSQFPVAPWHEQIGDPTLADGILDRLVHHAHRIEMNGDSMRKRSKP